MIAEIGVLVTQIGLPAVMCLWFMWRTDAVISKNTQSTDNLTIAVNTLVEQNRKH